MSEESKFPCVFISIIVLIVVCLLGSIWHDVTSKDKDLRRTFRQHLLDRGMVGLSKGVVFIDWNGSFAGYIYSTCKIDNVRKTVTSVFAIKKGYNFFKDTRYTLADRYSTEEETPQWMTGGDNVEEAADGI